jgi:hypothetical protein
LRSKEVILKEIEALVQEEGFSYTLCWALFEDFIVVPSEMHKMDIYSRLSINEALLLVGLWIKKKVNFDYPDSILTLIENRKKMYSLLEELHSSFSGAFIERLKNNMPQNENSSRSDFFGSGEMMQEPIFYSGTGAYDFQYINTLTAKYGNDKEWLIEKKGFDPDEVSQIYEECKSVLFEKGQGVRFISPEQEVEFKEIARENYKGNDFEKDYPDLLYRTKISQYFELMFHAKASSDQVETEEKIVQSFCDMILNLNIVSKSDFKNKSAFERLLKNFSVESAKGVNSQFNDIGDYNIASSHPLIKVDNENYLLPVSFVLAQTINESPFYWMMDDKNYLNEASENRGLFGEDSVYDILKPIFGKNVYKQVDVQLQKGVSATDIDILCILGSKAFCLQVKSKKLTTLAKKGNDEALITDFKGAVQDAYKQGNVSRDAILSNNAKFIKETGEEVELIDHINEVYIGVLVTEHYPSLLHQVSTYLERSEGQPAPVAFTLFDLDIVAHYMKDPFDFMYYLRQRIATIDNYFGDEEMSFLGWHLKHKLWVKDKKEIMMIDNSYAQLIDRNYYPNAAGIETPDETDPLLDVWNSEKFLKLLSEIKKVSFPKKTDIVFYLLDMSGIARDSIVDAMERVIQMTIDDGEDHNLSVPPDSSHSDRFGLTFYSTRSRDINSLKDKLFYLCNVRKYKSKAHRWLGVGVCGKGSTYADTVIYNDTEWCQDDELETLAQELKGGFAHFSGKKKKVGRNDKCPCGSDLKFKRCCIDKFSV